MNEQNPFSRPVGAYRRLDSFTLATIIQIETWRFCQQFLDSRNDPKGRWFDQMTQAARSGRANLIEGSENSLTSKEMELKLLGVARGSLGELLGDFEMWLAFVDAMPWTSREAHDIFDVRLDPMSSEDDLLFASAVHARLQRSKFARWLDSPDSCTRANCVIVLIRRAMRLIQKQMEALATTFAKTGGLREQMTAMRLEVRNNQREESSAQNETPPLCPKCGKPMRKRMRKNTGEAFWGCSGYAEGCRGTRPLE